MTENNRAVAVRSAMDVDEIEAGRLAEVFLRNQGPGMVFPQNMTAAQAVVLARMSIGYGLDPFGGELILFQGQPYLTIKGALRKAGDHPQFNGIECRPATKEERAVFRCGEAEHLWVARVWRKDRQFPFVGYGRSGPGDANPVSKSWPQEMAQKRAKHRALRDAFTLPLPGEEETGGYGGERPVGMPVIEGEIVGEEAVRLARPDQVTAIHTIAAALKIDDDEYRDELARWGVESSKQLTEGRASAFIEMLSMRQQSHGDDAESRVIDPATGEIIEHGVDGDGPSDGDTRVDADSGPGPGDEGAPSLAPDSGGPPPSAATPVPRPTAMVLSHYRLLLADAAKLGIDLEGYALNEDTVTMLEFGMKWNGLRDAIGEARAAAAKAAQA